jgi:D-alanine-D-alanine ligase
MHPPRTLILYNEPTLPADHPDAESEYDILYTADCVAKCLGDAGLPVTRLGTTDDPHGLLAGIKAAAPDVVFNLYEGTARWGNTEAFVSGLLEMLRIPFTGSPTQPLLLARSKPLTKQLLTGAGLPTAGYFALDALPVPKCPLKWPVIVKPGKEDASVGIDQASVVTSQRQLEDRVRHVLDRYGPPVLVEQFVRGREFNVAVWDRGAGPRTLPFSEILFLEQDGEAPLWPIVSFDAKWHPNSRDFKATPWKNPAELSPEMETAISDLAVRAYELVGCRDYARVDFRVDAAGQQYILEVNPNPCISPQAGLAAALETAKVPYCEFALSLVRSALRRGPRPELAEAVGSSSGPVAEPDLPPALERKGWRVRPARAADAGNVFDLVTACDALPPEERAAVTRRLRQRLRRRDRDGATILVLAGRGRIGGFAALAPTNPVQGGYGLEALVVEPSLRQRGFGRLLLARAEETVAAAGGRILTADISSGSTTAGPRQFLARVGYRPAGEVPEFYRDGSAKLTFAKTLPVVTPPAGPPAPVPTASRV